ncbi:MAG: hypothetical protein OET90_07105, partial [Desulfuromonadales bacterium]|nr:hypothetical protein [Desulfuromonadales bacterium]
MSETPRVNMKDVKTYSIHSRENKVNVAEHFASKLSPGMSFESFFDAMPNLLGADNMRGVVDAVVAAHAKQRPVVLALGGHV